ncbi:hypothetical protein ZIOFF_055468 [Zingiber officinale]|uniref:Uncharacterized protein n=1 Tax=Zingiber officinale TaxID=94328 RepID=A0A8J5KEL7_ZINOF|nr:hypothetical protein ZIOFF_055468 [Zingiber officinale]
MAEIEIAAYGEAVVAYDCLVAYGVHVTGNLLSRCLFRIHPLSPCCIYFLCFFAPLTFFLSPLALPSQYASHSHRNFADYSIQKDVRCCEFLLSNFYTNRSEYSGLSLVHDRTSPGYWASAQGYPTHNKEKLLGRLVGGDGRPHMRCLSTIPAPNVALGSSHLAPSSSNAAHISLKSIPEGLMQMIIDKIGECVLEKARAEARDEVVVALENFFQTIVAGANNDPNR